MSDLHHHTTLSLENLREGFTEPDVSSAPMMRWWWFGPKVSKAGITHQLDLMKEAGIGGVEIAFVYPLSESTDLFMSDSFLQSLCFAAYEAHSREMRFDITLGSGWSYGGPHITPDLAARRLHWERREIGSDEQEVAVHAAWPGDELVGAFIGDGSGQEPPTEYTPLERVAEKLSIPSANGPRVVLLAWSRLTGQNVKRAAAGAEGPVLDHYSLKATEAHIAAICDPMLNAVPADLVHSVFCDSLEVYGANWTPELPQEFKERRGYELTEHLWKLNAESQRGSRFRTDFHKTLSELYEENFVAPLREWANSRDVLFRIQSYGEPPASVSSYRYADLFEGEGWGWQDLTQSRWATSAANLYGKQIVSSEIWTWVHSPSFRATPLDLKGELHEHALIGINHFIGHGWPYHEEDDEGLGWIFYAAGALDERNPWWPAMKCFTKYAQRLAWLMRLGPRKVAVGIYAPYQDVYSLMGNGAPKDLDLWSATKKYIGPEIPSTLRSHGYDFDVIDDDALSSVDPTRFPVIVLPRVHNIPPETRDWLRKAEAAGATILRVGGSLELGEAVDDLLQPLQAHVAPPVDFSTCIEDARGLGVIHRVTDHHDIYLLANTTSRTISTPITVNTEKQHIEEWDLEEGALVRNHAKHTTLNLEPYEATVLVASNVASSMNETTSEVDSDDYQLIDDDWKVKFPDSEPATVRLPHRWEEEASLRGYSGGATYSVTFQWEHDQAAALLDFGTSAPETLEGAERAGVRGKSFRAQVVPPINVAAEVRINGRSAGLLWHPPYRLELINLVKGENSLEITVYNTAANALGEDLSVMSAVEASREFFGRRFTMQDLQHADATVISGILSVPRLYPLTVQEADTEEGK